MTTGYSVYQYDFGVKGKGHINLKSVKNVLRLICVIYLTFFRAFASVQCCLVGTCWERDDLLALLCDV